MALKYSPDFIIRVLIRSATVCEARPCMLISLLMPTTTTATTTAKAATTTTTLTSAWALVDCITTVQEKAG